MSSFPAAHSPKPLLKKASFSWLASKTNVKKDSAVHLTLAPEGPKGRDGRISDSDQSDHSRREESPELADRLTMPVSPTSREPPRPDALPAPAAAAAKGGPNASIANASLHCKGSLLRVLDDQHSLSKFVDFLRNDPAAETLRFYLRAAQHRLDLDRLHALTKHTHSMHIPTTAALALNISSTERALIEQQSGAFIKLEEPFAVAREAALDQLLRDAWPRFVQRRLALLQAHELCTLGQGKAGLKDLSITFCVVSAAEEDDFAIQAVSDGFSAVTGYSRSQSVGRSYRFLQGVDTDRVAMSRLLHACKQGLLAEEILLHYRADGSAFESDVHVIPLPNSDGSAGSSLVYQISFGGRDGIAALLDDRLDADRRGVGDGSTAPSVIKITAPQSMTREARLAHAATLVNAPQAPDMSSRSRSDSKTRKRSSVNSLKSMVGLDRTPSIPSAPKAIESSLRWLYLDPSCTVIHACAALQSQFRIGSNFASMVKSSNANLAKKVKQIAKSGDSVYEHGRTPGDGKRPDSILESALALVPLKDREGKVVGIVVLFETP